MNTDLIKSIIGLVVAAIPLIIAIVTLHYNRTESVSDSVIDSPSLKVLYIKRTQVDHVLTKNRKIKVVTFPILIFAVVILYISFIFYFQFSNQIVFIIGFYFISLLSLISIIIVLTYFIFRYRNDLYKSYALYKDIEIRIDAEHQYLFNKSYESLRSLKFKIVEVDEQCGRLLAFYVRALGIIKQFTIKVEKEENSETLHTVKLKLEGKNFAESSRVINRFINSLISKPKNTDHKSKD
jgi:hypothetical protein